MSRRMSCSLTTDAVRERRKTVTRRHIDTWKLLEPGDHLTLIEQGMGLPKGSKQVILAEVEIVTVDPVWLIDITPDEVAREGLSPMTPLEFIVMWLKSHGYRNADAYEVPCRRIEWRYLPSIITSTTGEQQ